MVSMCDVMLSTTSTCRFRYTYHVPVFSSTASTGGRLSVCVIFFGFVNDSSPVFVFVFTCRCQIGSDSIYSRVPIGGSVSPRFHFEEAVFIRPHAKICRGGRDSDIWRRAHTSLCCYWWREVECDDDDDVEDLTGASARFFGP